MNEKIYIGIDPSLAATGIAAIDNNYLHNNKVVKFDEIQTKKTNGIDNIDRCDYISDRVIDFVSIYPQAETFIMIEDYFVGSNKQTIIKLAELQTLIRYKLKQAGYNYFTIPPKTLKKEFCCNGNATKEEMIAQAKVLCFDTSSDNIADAFALAYICKQATA